MTADRRASRQPEQTHVPDRARTRPRGDRDATEPAVGWRRELRAGAELTAMCAVAIAQPLLEVFGNSAQTFIVHRAATLEILAFVAVIVLVPPLLLWGAERAVGFVDDRARRVVHVLALAGLGGLLGVQLAKQVGLTAPAAVAAGGLAVAGVLAVLVVRSATFGVFLRYLALSPILFVVLFLGFSPVRHVAFPGGAETAPLTGADDGPPVVLVVLDELPTRSLLDGDGGIDATMFPNFAALAADATWYRNHTTVAPQTVQAVPALLTGRWPDDYDAAPVADRYPQNLFTLLGGSYEIHAHEEVTRLCPAGLCDMPTDRSRAGRVRVLLGDAASVWRTRVSPRTAGEIGFYMDIAQSDDHAERRFAALAASFHEGGARPGLHYLHVLMPHQDWIRLPDGTRYDAPNPPTGIFFNELSDDGARMDVARQRHLAQVAFADRLLGELLGELRAAGVYDDALIVVTSDHGVSFRPGELLRPLTDANGADIAWIPLLVKAPGQREGVVDDTPVTLVDVLPTIAAHLDLVVPWEMDGVPADEVDRPERWAPRLFRWDDVDNDSARHPPPGEDYVTVDPTDFDEVLAARAVPAGGDPELRLYRIGAHGGLVGEEIDGLLAPATAESDDGRWVRLDEPERFDDVDPDADLLPVYLEGSVRSPEPVRLAVALNGRVAGWYDASRHAMDDRESFPFGLLVAPSLLVAGGNEVTFYRIEGEPGAETLHPIPRADTAG